MIQKISNWWKTWRLARKFVQLNEYQLNLMESRIRRDGQMTDGLERLFNTVRGQTEEKKERR